ncbi:MAG TPA: O-antigen ligase family protein, partial [Flavobacteriales bacterium]|nr:O-antigen ligase family protein [Flavobacteriales bacterium]
MWVAAGFIAGPIAMGIVGIFMLLFGQKEWTEQLIIGFLFMLILSDSLSEPLAFAKSFKNIYIIFLSFYVIARRDIFDYSSTLHKYFLPFLFFAVVGIAFSPQPDIAIQKTLSYFLLLWIVPNYLVTSFQREGVTFLRNMVLFMFTICAAGYLLGFISPETAYSHGARFRGIFGNPNGMGVFLLMFTIFFHIVRKKFPELFTRHELIIIYLSILFFVFLTGSRNALLSILLFFMFSYFFRISTILGFIIFMVVIVLTEYITANFVSFVGSLGLSEELRVETLKEGSGRLVAWKFAWDEINRSLFIGRGMGYDEYYMRKNATVLLQLGHEGGVHNSYLILWLNTGLLGFISFFIAFFTLFIRASLTSKLAFPAMIAVMFSINFEPWLAASLNPYTIILLCSLTLILHPVFDAEVPETTNEITEENTLVA